MFRFTLIVCAGALFASAAQLHGKPHYDLEDAEEHFAVFVREHDKYYANDQERQMRFEIFKDTLKKINERNEKGEHAEFGITLFADLTTEEFLKQHTGYLKNGDLKSNRCTLKTGADVPMHGAPDAYDWRDHTAVTDVKNQGVCGCCWAFSIIGVARSITFLDIQTFYETFFGPLNVIGEPIAGSGPYIHVPELILGPAGFLTMSSFTVELVYNIVIGSSLFFLMVCFMWSGFLSPGNLEGQYGIKNKKLIDFSPQQLNDCDHVDQACDGGLITQGAFELKNMGGVMSDEDYPFAETLTYECHFDIKKSKAKVVDCYQYKLDQDEDKLKSLLHSQGPLAIALNGRSLQTYKKGVLQDCEGIDINHAVLLVGYGEEKGIPYWIIKNSWGMKFGEKGYVRVERGINSCGLMDDAQVTVVL